MCSGAVNLRSDDVKGWESVPTLRSASQEFVGPPQGLSTQYACFLTIRSRQLYSVRRTASGFILSVFHAGRGCHRANEVISGRVSTPVSIYCSGPQWNDDPRAGKFCFRRICQSHRRSPVGKAGRAGRYLGPQIAILLSLFSGTMLLNTMRRWLTALTGSSLLLLFPLAIAYLPYDHWDHVWLSVNVVFALGLVCAMLGAALVLSRSAISVTRQLLLGTSVVSLLAGSFGASVRALDPQLGRTIFSPWDTLTKPIAIAAALAVALLACRRGWKTRWRSMCWCQLSARSLVAGTAIGLRPRYSPLRI